MCHALYCFFFSSLQYGTTPLIWAARKGHYESVMHLLANGADVDQEGAVSRLKIFCESLLRMSLSYLVMELSPVTN